eukprot:5010264-Pyramimonas_sp.AAC.1
MYSGRGLGDAGGVSFLRVISRAKRRRGGVERRRRIKLKGIEVGRRKRGTLGGEKRTQRARGDPT